MTAAIVFRDPTPDERLRLAKLWGEEASPETSLLLGDDSGDRFVRIGRSRRSASGAAVDRSIGLSPRVWFKLHRLLVAALAVDGADGAQVRAACLVSVPDVALGFVCWTAEPGQLTVHWVAVEHGTRRGSPRRRGIGLALLRHVAAEAAAGDLPIRFSHQTPLGLALCRRWRELDTPKDDPCTRTMAAGGSTTTTQAQPEPVTPPRPV